ncbi:DUF4190 domain-containing protein [Microbacterium sp. MYb62]|uniref:DUF4190 domain-containing protein n=1 Tax=Microbacterium sp. MYb62 TaxID=1848690 RepID=UPI000D410E0D|nr:DUF4190 domain-containing protein [Microbacterium sp. MYb62]PRB16014.1 hypothetical protein CQ042_07815 [Microbacterium sp. MYb62]
MTNPPFPDPPSPDSSSPDSSSPDSPAAGASTPAPPPPVTAETPPPATADAPPPAPAWNSAADAGYPSAASAAPAYPQPTPTPPGRVLSIVGLVLAVLVAPVGLIISIVAAVKLSKAKEPKGLAIAGIIVGALITIFWIVVLIIVFTLLAAVIGMCAELGPGVWQVDGVNYRCG